MDIEEDLEQAVRNINQRVLLLKGIYFTSVAEQSLTELDLENETPTMTLDRRPELVDDFIRNFLANKNLTKTLDCFQVSDFSLVRINVVIQLIE